jgi:hypothetical protein
VDALPLVTPFTSQVTALFDDPVTDAVNVCVAPARTLALFGETDTVTLDDGNEGDEVDPAEFDATLVTPVHPASATAANASDMRIECRKAIPFNSFRVNRHTESAALAHQIPCSELCLGVGRRTTVRRDKIGRGTLEQN